MSRPSVARCSLCRGDRPSPSCPRCQLRQPSLFEPPPPPPSPDELLRSRAVEDARLAVDRARRERRRAILASGRAPVVALVGCGRRKAPARAPARDLYLGALFRRSLAFAERFADEVFVLSALHRLVELDHELDPYDFAMHDLRLREQDRWADQVTIALLRTCGRIPLRLIGLAGRAYLDPLVIPMAQYGWRIERPLDGLGVGARLAWLRSAAAQAMPV